MARKPDKSVGITIFISSIMAFIIYAWLLLVSEWSAIVLQLTVLAAVAALLAVLAWMGYAMATTPSPPSAEQEQKFSPREVGREGPQN
ncbi:MAG: transcriptional regulator [Nitrososphaerales archaeon]